jgi:putative transposase
MARHPRIAPGGLVYHVLNRSVGRVALFRKDSDFESFSRLVAEALERHPIRILSYCILPTHWHFVAWPHRDGQLTEFFRWLTHTHAMRWRAAHGTVGYGPLYQGRFKSFPIQRDEHLLTVCRYVERNPVAIALVQRAELWQCSSLWARMHKEDAALSPWPVEVPPDWLEQVNTPLPQKDLDRMTISIQRSRPFGSDPWLHQTISKLGLEHTIRPKGRPKGAATQIISTGPTQ